MASQRFQNVYSGHRTGWNTKQEWEVWERWGRKRVWFIITCYWNTSLVRLQRKSRLITPRDEVGQAS